MEIRDTKNVPKKQLDGLKQTLQYGNRLIMRCNVV